jgi:hypothetical protein
VHQGRHQRTHPDQHDRTSEHQAQLLLPSLGHAGGDHAGVRDQVRSGHDLVDVAGLGEELGPDRG